MGNRVRYLHGETLGRWRTADLLIGLVYLSQRGYGDSPAAHLATQGRVIGLDLDADAPKEPGGMCACSTPDARHAMNALHMQLPNGSLCC